MCTVCHRLRVRAVAHVLAGGQRSGSGQVGLKDMENRVVRGLHAALSAHIVGSIIAVVLSLKGVVLGAISAAAGASSRGNTKHHHQNENRELHLFFTYLFVAPSSQEEEATTAKKKTALLLRVFCRCFFPSSCLPAELISRLLPAG